MDVVAWRVPARHPIAVGGTFVFWYRTVDDFVIATDTFFDVETHLVVSGVWGRPRYAASDFCAD